MTHLPGQTVLQYTIIEKLGEGGMGVVYKAEDTKLRRTVALKFLPHDLESRESERARFLQEAQAAAVLNHPNICTVYDILEHDGEQFIVMEFVDGKTLRRMVPIENLQAAVTYAVQIGEALQEAHAKGVVHRDIKTDNILVNSKNQVKVTDFGLAKLRGSIKLTKTRSTVGTLAYMAPEQIQGGHVDARADIFSFGVVLYEMITGRLPFQGEHEAGIMYSILNEEPSPAEQHRTGLPSEILHVLQRALEKSPDERYQSVAEMVIDLRRIHRQSTRVSRPLEVSRPPGIPVDQDVTRGSAPPAVKKRWAVLVPVAVVLVAAAVWFILRISSPSSIAGKLNPNMSFRVVQIPFSQISYPGLSQDGNWIAFPAADANRRWDVYFMNSGTNGEARRVTRDSSIAMNTADVSPDGGRIAYDRGNIRSGRAEVAVISSLGGVSKLIAPVGVLPRWNPSGDRVGFVRGLGTFAPSASGKLELWSVKPDGTDARREFIDSASVPGRFSFSWSPDGRYVAWIVSFRDGSQELVVRELATGNIRQLTFDRKSIDEVCWTHQGEIVFSSNKSGNMNLWMISVSGGEALQITRGSGPDFGMKISADGTRLLYYQQRTVSNIWIAGLDGSNPHPLTSEDRRLTHPALSPDGRMVVFEIWGTDLARQESSIAVMNLDGSARREITSGDGIAQSPQWSPDGTWIAFLTHGPGEPVDSSRLEVVDAVNPGAARVLGRSVGFGWLDQQTLAFGCPVGGKYRTTIATVDGTLSRVFAEDSSAMIPILQQTFALSFWPRPEKPELRLVPMERGTPDWAHTVVVNREPWTDFDRGPDDSFVLLVNNPDRIVKIFLPSGRREELKHKIPGLTINSRFHLSSDGRQIVYNDSKLNGSLVMIENLR
jgi:eukaryotic-like serine/threonine-protein kinase